MKQYDQQFKEQALELVLDLGRPVKTVAEELGIHENTLYKWINKYKKDQEHAFPGSGKRCRKTQKSIALRIYFEEKIFKFF